MKYRIKEGQGWANEVRPGKFSDVFVSQDINEAYIYLAYLRHRFHYPEYRGEYFHVEEYP